MNVITAQQVTMVRLSELYFGETFSLDTNSIIYMKIDHNRPENYNLAVDLETGKVVALFSDRNVIPMLCEQVVFFPITKEK